VRKSCSSWLWDAGNIGAWAVGDGDGLAVGSSVGVGSLSEGSGVRAVGGVDISGDSGGNVGTVPSSTPGTSTGDEAEGGNERLERLHVDESEFGIL